MRNRTSALIHYVVGIIFFLIAISFGMKGVEIAFFGGSVSGPESAFAYATATIYCITISLDQIFRG